MLLLLSVVTAIYAAATSVAAFVVLPGRVQALEIKIEGAAAASVKDREALIRIEERLRAIQDQLDRMQRTRNPNSL